jgi:hypothetical protein
MRSLRELLMKKLLLLITLLMVLLVLVLAALQSRCGDAPLWTALERGTLRQGAAARSSDDAAAALAVAAAAEATAAGLHCSTSSAAVVYTACKYALLECTCDALSVSLVTAIPLLERTIAFSIACRPPSGHVAPRCDCAAVGQSIWRLVMRARV